MKFILKYFKIIIFFIVTVNVSIAQNDNSLKRIDSVKTILKTLKPTDSLNIAKQNYIVGEYYRKLLNTDSAYVYFHKAEKVFKQYNLKYETAITMFGIAVCQTYDKDYTGSETTSFQAIALLESLNQTNSVRQYKGYIYNNLGIVFEQLEEFDKSIKYLNISLDLKKGLKGDYVRSIGNSENNLAKTYLTSGNYNLAIKQFEAMLANKKLVNSNLDIKVLVLGNYAHALDLANKHDRLPGLYLKALKLSDSINDTYNAIVIHQHLAEFYHKKGIIDSAKYYAYKAKNLSEFYNNDDMLKSLLLVSKIEHGEISRKYLLEYIALSDSLYKSEREKRDKFARIKFETEAIEKENIEKEKVVRFLFSLSVIILIIAVLIYLFLKQREKNKVLQFKQSQQESNEEIYNLMLTQNLNIEEARAQEKRRISQELHDGILGRLFGTRLSLDSLNFNTGAEAVQTRSQYISELKNIEEDIRKVSHELNTDFVSGGGFKDIIHNLIESKSAIYNLKYTFNHYTEINWDNVSNKTKIHIYRIIQESLHNIYKHANATQVNISFNLKKDVICITMEDDGAGFDVSKVKSGIGLKNIKSRILEINGTITINSKKNKGTSVTLEAPLIS